jgi:hypothetical protein
MHISLDSALGRQRRLNSVGESVFQIAPNAAAGYSLRSLTGGDPAVVRVRRASDNSEKDFNSSGVSSGELVNWVNAQIVPPLDVRELVDGERTGALIPAAAAYSLRNLSASYTGDVVEVRRNTDGATLDFSAAEVADGTLTNWVNTSFADALPLDTASGASAAYSLRNLSTSYTGNVVDVRRSSDDAEDSFTAAEVADGTLEDWVTANQSGRFNFASGDNNWLSYDGGTNDIYNLETYGTTTLRQAYDHIEDADSIGSSPTSDSNYSYKFDSRASEGYNTAQGLRIRTRESDVIPFNVTFKYFIPEGQPAIATLYTSKIIGNLTTTGAWTEVTVRNTNYINNGVLIRSSAYNTTGGVFYIADVRITYDTSNGFVSQWYDQSGNGNHATQATPASQPKIVDSGSLLNEIKFDGVDDVLNFTEIDFSTNSWMLSAVVDWDGSVSPIVGGSTSQWSLQVATSDNFSSRATSDSTIHNFDPTATITTGDGLFTVQRSNDVLSGYYDGAFDDAAPAITAASEFKADKIGQRASLYCSSGVKEIIIYNTDQTANRPAIESNIASHYSITLPTGSNPGSVDGFVSTWYDQSGNANDAVQATATSQPKIVDGGVLVSGGIDFDGVDDYLNRAAVLTNIQDAFMTLVATARNSTGGHICDASTSPDRFVIQADQFNYGDPSDNITLTMTDDEIELITASASSGTMTGYQNGSSAGTAVSDEASSTGTMSIGAFTNGAGPFDGLIAELIIYDSDQSANSAAIETNINTKYSIY